MQTTARNNGSRIAVSDPGPLRFIGAVTMVLLIAALIASSTAHSMALGDAVAQSALGAPLRVVIPITAASGESLRSECFRLAPAAGDGSAQIVTARVSLERAASAPRLLVTTANPVNEPAIRFILEANCDGSVRRSYVLLLDPPEAGASAAAAAAAIQATAPEPRRGPLALQAATARRSPASSATSATQIVHVPESTDSGAHLATTTTEHSDRKRLPSGGAIMPTAFRQVAAAPPVAIAAAAPSPFQPASLSEIRIWPIAAALAVVMVLGLAGVFARRRQASPEIPQWTRSRAASGPRSFADLSAAPVTLQHTLSHAGATTQAPSARSSSPAASSLRIEASTSPSSMSRSAVDPSTIDTLLDEVDPDIIEERAVREAWAAARNDVEREMDGNAILRAIEEAERELYLAPRAPAQSAIERALDDDLLQPVRPH